MPVGLRYLSRNPYGQTQAALRGTRITLSEIMRDYAANKIADIQASTAMKRLDIEGAVAKMQGQKEITLADIAKTRAEADVRLGEEKLGIQREELGLQKRELNLTELREERLGETAKAQAEYTNQLAEMYRLKNQQMRDDQTMINPYDEMVSDLGQTTADFLKPLFQAKMRRGDFNKQMQKLVQDKTLARIHLMADIGAFSDMLAMGMQAAQEGNLQEDFFMESAQEAMREIETMQTLVGHEGKLSDDLMEAAIESGRNTYADIAYGEGAEERIAAEAQRRGVRTEQLEQAMIRESVKYFKDVASSDPLRSQVEKARGMFGAVAMEVAAQKAWTPERIDQQVKVILRQPPEQRAALLSGLQNIGIPDKALKAITEKLNPPKMSEKKLDQMTKRIEDAYSPEQATAFRVKMLEQGMPDDLDYLKPIARELVISIDFLRELFFGRPARAIKEMTTPKEKTKPVDVSRAVQAIMGR